MARVLRLRVIPNTDENIDFMEEQQFGNEYAGNDTFSFNTKTKCIIPYLTKLSLPDNIIQSADVVYNKMRPQVRRSNTYNMLLYYCTYCAYLEEIHKQRMLIQKRILPDLKGYISGFDPYELGRKFGLEKSQIQKCDSLFSPLQTGFKPQSSYISLYDHLPNYSKFIGLSDECILDVIDLAKSIVDKDRTLNRENARTTAAGILYYYTIINGITITNMDELLKLIGYKFQMIKIMSDRIAIIDNS